MLCPTETPERAGSTQPVVPVPAAIQWTHTVPNQMPWTLPPSQQPFPSTGPIGNGSFLRQNTSLVPNLATAPVVSPTGPAIRASPGIVTTMKLPQTLPSGTIGNLNDIVSDPKSLLRQSETSQQPVLYPGDPCTSTTPQIVSLTGDTGANKSTMKTNLFAKASNCSINPKSMKRKCRSLLLSGEEWWSAPSYESDEAGGKVFVTERMVARMGDLSLCDRQQLNDRTEFTDTFISGQQTAKSMASESSPGSSGRALRSDGRRLSELSNTAFPLNNSEVNSAQQYKGFGSDTDDSSEMNEMKQISLNEPDKHTTLKDDQTIKSPLLMCSDVKSAMVGNSSIEQRLAIEMMKKSTMAVVLWSPLKSPLPLPPTRPARTTSNFYSGSTDMEQQNSDSSSPDSRVPLADEVGLMNEDVMEVM